MIQELIDTAALSRKFGSTGDYVFLGGGNTSYKTADSLYIKPSGTTLATLQPEQMIAMDRKAIRRLFSETLPEGVWEREAAVKSFMAEAVRPVGSGRPSVEAPVHEVIEYRYVFHLHPVLVNGMTCAKEGRAACERLFPEALWIEYVNPGFTLSTVFAERLARAKAERGTQPKVIFLQNHGVFVGADSLAEIEEIYSGMVSTFDNAYKEAGVQTVLATTGLDPAVAAATAPVLRTRLGSGSRAVVQVVEPFEVAAGPLTPDHIVYAKSFPLANSTDQESLQEFEAKRGYLPKVISLEGQAVFAAGDSLKDAKAAAIAAKDAARVRQLAQAFGGPNFLSESQYGFIENWEVEAYRRAVSASTSMGSRLKNRVCIVTGGAQGFGLGIVRGLAAAGGIIGVADLNVAGAEAAAAAINEEFGQDRAFALSVNIADEESVQSMMAEIIRTCGGLDLFVANAGVLKAGSVMEMSKRDWDFVTNVNYTGYFLCVKHASPVMAAQAVDGEADWTDIVQINSKSGLEGSNRNGAYAGSKFGTIGLTQSFAKELVEKQIKVNSICPGNYFDGPLWSDPVKGLFVQYLSTGKVPGAKTLEDVRSFYEKKVPMARGCRPEDVVAAILYCVEQKYETGQAIPVTGGQVMLS